MLVRTARISDAVRIAEIHVHAWQQAYERFFPADYLGGLSVAERSELWRGRLETMGPPMVLVAEAAEALVGWISIGPSRDPDAGAYQAEVYALYVDPPAWGRGFGKALWSAAEAAALSSGWDRVTVWVFEGNDRARRFYEGRGLALESGQRKLFEREGHAVPELRYARALGVA